MTNTEPVKGFRDFSGEEAQKREEIRKIIVETFEKYGFEPAETPIIEYEDFVRGENQQDEAVSDIFKLQDKGKRKLALRYEFTFQLKRLMKNKKLPYKRYQIGPVFRDEPVSSNRLRQFTQCDCDTIGADFKDEVDIFAMLIELFKKLNIDFEIYFNNRKLLNEILESQKIKKENRESVIREVDKFEKFTEKEIKENLKKINAEKIIDILNKPEKYFERYNSFIFIKQIKDYAKKYKMKIKFKPSLARGLSYYDGTVFEIKARGAKDTIVGGGAFTFNNIPSFGFGMGLERIYMVANVSLKKEKFLVISLNQDKKAIELAKKLRNANKIVSVYYGKPSKALDYANSYNFNSVVFAGEKEVRSGKFKIKDMKTGKESELKFKAKSL